MAKLQANVFDNERLTGLFSYLDRLQALSDVGYTCSREIAECVKAVREELALEKSEGIVLKEGESLSVHMEGMDESLYIAGPTVVTTVKRKDVEGHIDSFAEQIATRLAKETGDAR